jgi:hypothetical protein
MEEGKASGKEKEMRVYRNDGFRRIDGLPVSLGIFYGRRLNYLKQSHGGAEVFMTSNRSCPAFLSGLFNFHIGIAKPKWPKRVYWSGSLSEPDLSMTIRIGWLWYGRPTPAWLRRWRLRKWEREAEKLSEEMDRYYEEMYPDEEPIGDEFFEEFDVEHEGCTHHHCDLPF